MILKAFLFQDWEVFAVPAHLVRKHGSRNDLLRASDSEWLWDATVGPDGHRVHGAVCITAVAPAKNELALSVDGRADHSGWLLARAVQPGRSIHLAWRGATVRLAGDRGQRRIPGAVRAVLFGIRELDAEAAHSRSTD